MVHVLAALLLLTVPASAAEVESLVGITNDVGTISGTAVDIDLSTGAGTAIASVSRPGISLAYVSDTEQLLAVLPLGGGRNQLTLLANRGYGEVRPVGVITDSADGYTHKISAMGATDDRLYGISRRFGNIGGFPVPEGLLVEIDPATAVATTIGAMGTPVRSRGGTIKDGQFFLVTNPDKTSPEQLLYTISLQTGAATLVGSTGIYGKAVGLTTGPDNTLLAALSGDATSGQSSWDPTSRLYELSASSGQAQLIGSTGFDYISSLTYLRFTVNCGIVTARDLTVEGNTLIDSWDSTAGPYVSQPNAQVCSNGVTSVAAGTAILDGDLYWGTSVSIGGGAVVTGSTEALVAPALIPQVDTTAAAVDNDNHLVPELSDGTLSLRTRGQLTLPAGRYYLTELTLGTRSTLNVEGPVEIWVDGPVSFGVDSTFNSSGLPTQMTLYTAGSTVVSAGTSYATIVAPYAAVTLDGRGATYGALVSDALTFNGQHTFHQDDAVAVF